MPAAHTLRITNHNQRSKRRLSQDPTKLALLKPLGLTPNLFPEKNRPLPNRGRFSHFSGCAHIKTHPNNPIGSLKPLTPFSGCLQSYTIHPIRSIKDIIMNWRILPIALTLAACTYSETPFGRYAEIDLPLQSQTTIHKTVTVNAPAGTTVNIRETPVYTMPPPPPPRRCYYDEYERRRVCYR